MRKILILEDNDVRIAQFHKNWTNADLTIVKTAADAIRELKENGPFDDVCLDHDLGGQVYVKSGKGTGYEVAEYIANNSDVCRVVHLHTANPAGRDNMFHVLYKESVNVRITPFVWTQEIDFK